MGLGNFLGALAPIAGAGIGSMFGNPTLGASIGGMVGGAIGQANTNAANAEQAEINRQFQAQQSATSYQRAVKDMAAAGLNPMLAYSQGGASTPAGSTAQMGNVISGGMSTAMQTMQTIQGMAQIKQTNAATKLTENQADSAEIDAKRKEWELAADLAEEAEASKSTNAISARALAARAELARIRANTALQGAQREQTKVQTQHGQLGIAESKAASDFWSKTGDAPLWLKGIMQFLSDGKRLLK